jgi:uncharacterized membrane protein
MLRKENFQSGAGTVWAMLILFGILVIPVFHAEGAPPPSRPLLFLYPEKTFAAGKAQYYEYKTEDGIRIKYFIIKSADGVIRAAFDACDVCWREGKGYAQKGDFMVCRNCGQRFASLRINEVKGGCNPGPLAREIKGGNVVIKTSDILEGKRYFDFGGKG